MKKIMFNDKFGLTDAVLKGNKTMTRRTVWGKYLRIYEDMSRLGQPCYLLEEWLIRKAAAYKVGEVVAVAQNYHDVYEELKRTHGSSSRVTREFFHKYVQGGRMPVSNKMFVRADLMSHQIRITDVKVERLQDISDGDCFKEGIIPITWRQHLPQAIDDLTPQKYIDHNVYTLEKFREGIEDCWAESDPNEYMAEDAKTAFAVLIFKTLGRKVWERNPYVFAYTFELVK